MTHAVESFGLVLLVLAGVGLGALLSNQLSEWIRIPAPAFFLLVTAVVSELVPGLDHYPFDAVQHVGTVGLILILFDGGMSVGWRRFRSEAGPIVWIGIVATFATAAAMAALAHFLLGFGWLSAMLLGTALSPTDPAVVFSVLGRKEVTGRSGTLLQGESGINDPVGVALLAGLLELTGNGAPQAVGQISLLFLEQMGIGAVVGFAAGIGMLKLLHHVPLPGEGLYLLVTLAGSLGIYGIAVVAHGSGFLAVFCAGLVLGDTHAPYKGDIRRFHGGLASLGEVAAFVGLGLTFSLDDFAAVGAWYDGFILFVLLALLVRPLVLFLMLAPTRLPGPGRVFLAFAGLKGAVPILLGSFAVTSQAPEHTRIYDVIFVVVAASVVVQGSLLPTVAKRCRVPMRTIPLRPWTLGVRFQERPEGIRRHRVRSGSPADGTAVADLGLPERAWITLLIRDDQPVPVLGETTLHRGDEVLLLTDPDDPADDAGDLFTGGAHGARGSP